MTNPPGSPIQPGHQPHATLVRMKQHQEQRGTGGGYVGGFSGVTLAKVTGRNSDGTVSVTTASGGTYPAVPVMSWSLGSGVGEVYLPAFTAATPNPSLGPTWDSPAPSGVDLYCVIAEWEGNARTVVCLGFVQPPVQAQMVVTPGTWVRRHESGTWEVATPGGQWALSWPDGSFFTAGPATTPPDMTAQNPLWNPPTGPAVNVVLKHSTGAVIAISPEGAITITPASGQPIVLGTGADAKAVARVGDTVAVSGSSGTITSGSDTVSAS